MENIVVENQLSKIVVTLNKCAFDENYLISLLKRLKVEELSFRMNFSDDVLELADQINHDWWENNKGEFLKGVKI